MRTENIREYQRLYPASLTGFRRKEAQMAEDFDVVTAMTTPKRGLEA